MSADSPNGPPEDHAERTAGQRERVQPHAARATTEQESDANDPPASRPPLQIDPVDVRDLLRRALEPPAVGRSRTVLTSVQQRIRAETNGRFFADGWSTSVAPRATYLVTAIVMLLVTVVLWFLLRPQDLELLR